MYAPSLKNTNHMVHVICCASEQNNAKDGKNQIFNVLIFLLGLKLTEADQELYKNFPLVISERWQNEVLLVWLIVYLNVFNLTLSNIFLRFKVAETVFDTINFEYDKLEQKKAKQKKIAKFGNDEKDSDVILHGYVKKLVS